VGCLNESGSAVLFLTWVGLSSNSLMTNVI
jgi:hypothetical protein